MRTDREKIDLLFGEVGKLARHTYHCKACAGMENWLGSKRHLAWIVEQINALYDCLDEPEKEG